MGVLEVVPAAVYVFVQYIGWQLHSGGRVLKTGRSCG